MVSGMRVQPRKTFHGAGKAVKASRAKTFAKTSREKAISALRATANIRTGGFAALEKKFVDTTRASAAFTTAWAILAPSGGITNCLTCPGIGTGEEQRDGRTYTIHSIHVKGNVIMPAIESQAAPLDDLSYRIVLVWDTQTNGGAITGTSVMDAGSTTDVNSFRNLQNSKRFIVLWDSGHRVFRRTSQTNEGAVNLFACGQNINTFMINKSFKMGIKVRCIGTTADVASVSDNSFSLIGLAGSTALNITYESRCRFIG